MGLYNSYATDTDAEKNGVVVVYPDIERAETEAYRVRLAHLSGRSSRYKKARARIMEPYAKFDHKDLPQEVADRTGIEIFIEAAIVTFETKVHADHVVDEKLGKPEPGAWVRGVELPPDETGKVRLVVASPENLYIALSAARPFMEVMLADASGADLYRVARRQAAAKNS